MSLEKFVLDLAAGLAQNAIERELTKDRSPFDDLKVKAKLDEIVVAVAEPLCQFLINEKISEQRARIICASAVPHIEYLSKNSEFALSRGLDSSVITKDLLSKSTFPRAVDEHSEERQVFETVLRSFVDIVVKTPAAMKNWEANSFKANFRQLDELKSTLSEVYLNMAEIKSSLQPDPSLLQRIINHLASTIALQVNIHGLRKSPIPQALIDKLYVYPSFTKGNEVDDKVQVFESHPDILRILDEKGARLLVVAPAGAGKSTWVKWTSSALIKELGGTLPIVVELRKEVGGSEFCTLTQLVSRSAPRAFFDQIGSKEVSDWATEGRLLLLFDGLDEVAEGSRDAVVNWIAGICSAHPNVNVVVTGRPLTTDHFLSFEKSGWQSVSLDAFDESRVETYIERFQEHGPEIQTGAEPKSPKALAGEWCSDPTLGPLTGNPLLLSTLLVVHHMDGELPDDRSALYDRYIDGMLGLWEINKELPTPEIPMTKEQKKKILEILAINMIANEADAASEADVSLWLKAYVDAQGIPGGIENILAHLRERSGLLVGPGQYSFAHKSIGEFLVSQACVDQIEKDFNGQRFDRKLLEDKCANDRWRTVTFLWAGLASKLEVQQFIVQLIESNQVALAAGLFFERRRHLDPEWIQATFWWLLSEFCRSPDTLSKRAFPITDNHGPKSVWVPGEIFVFRELESITSISLYDYSFVYTFLKEGICNANDWNKVDGGMPFTYWTAFAKFADFTEDFLKCCTGGVSDDARKFKAFGPGYSFANNAVSRSPSDVLAGFEPSLGVPFFYLYWVSFFPYWGRDLEDEILRELDDLPVEAIFSIDPGRLPKKFFDMMAEDAGSYAGRSKKRTKESVASQLAEFISNAPPEKAIARHPVFFEFLKKVAIIFFKKEAKA